MFVQTENTPNPNSLKFLPGKKVSNDVPVEIIDKNESNNELIRNILSINGVKGIFLSDSFFCSGKTLILFKYSCRDTTRLSPAVNDLCKRIPSI